MARILWEGDSQLSWRDDDGQTVEAGTPIVVLATRAAKPENANSKTGDMWQTYILRADMMPSEAIQTGADGAVCGNCPLRRDVCYAAKGNPIRGANGMWKLYAAGRSKPITPAEMTGAPVRLGAYGDPAAAPTSLWADVTAQAEGWTGYTHQWETGDPEMARYTMASCQDVEGQERANDAGYRAYTVTPLGIPKIANAVPCPYPRVQCDVCQKCSGTAAGRRGNVSIEVHGPGKSRFITTGKGE